MKNVFVDTDVVLDFLIDREPFSSRAAKIFTLSEQKKIVLFVTSLTYSNSYYILRRLASHKKVIEKLTTLEHLTKVIEVNKSSVDHALKSRFKDFEDALQYFSAIQNEKLELIITKNTKDYKFSDLPIMSPETFVKLIENEASA